MARQVSFRNTRNYENLQKAMFWGAGEYDIPEIAPVRSLDVARWIPFNYVKGEKDQADTGVHFFLDDYQFERVWRFPDKYVPVLGRFKAVCSPDFSPYSDFPKVIQLYNHYRKHWCAAYWQSKGMTVVPTITWSSPETLEWAFDGEPVGGVVAYSAVGMLADDEVKQWLLDGYAEMLRWLEPTKILWKGRVPDELKSDEDSGLICRLPSFTDKWHEVDAAVE